MFMNILTKSQIVLHDADWFPGRRRAGWVIMWRLWDMGVSPICIGGSWNTNSDRCNPQARSLLTRTLCPDINFVLIDHVVDVYTCSVIAEDWLFWRCEEGGGGVAVHFSSALHQFVVSHFCPQPHVPPPLAQRYFDKPTSVYHCVSAISSACAYLCLSVSPPWMYVSSLVSVYSIHCTLWSNMDCSPTVPQAREGRI